MKKQFYIVILLSILLGCIRTWAFSISDPNDPLYKLISAWDDKGYIHNVPLIRPYPPQLIRHYLKEVISKGSEVDRERALAVRESLDGKRSLVSYDSSPGLFVLNADTYAELLINQKAGESLLRPGVEFGLGGCLNNIISYDGKLGIFINEKEESKFTPYKQEPAHFFQSGTGTTTGESTLEHFWNGGLFIGNEKLYFQAGLMRTSFGPFFDNGVVIGPQAPEAGHFSFTYTGKYFSFSSILLELVAKYAVQTDGERYEIKYPPPSIGDNILFSDKHLVIHSADFHPFDWLSVGFIQSILYGGRFDPLYLIPFQVLAGAQTFIGDWDNSLIGMYSKLRPFHNLNFSFLIYLDDLNMNEIVKLNFNSDQNKLAFQTGVSWAPELPLFLRLSLDYLLVTPYMYTHASYVPLNYLTYTHNGSHLGSVLDPNSDQITLKAFIIVNDWLQGEIYGRFIRHGNHSVPDDVPDEWEGTIWDDGYENGSATFFGESTFLSQSVLEKVFQVGINIDFQLPVKFLDILLQADYVFELIKNKRFVEHTSETNHYIKLLLGIRL